MGRGKVQELEKEQWCFKALILKSFRFPRGMCSQDGFMRLLWIGLTPRFYLSCFSVLYRQASHSSWYVLHYCTWSPSKQLNSLRIRVDDRYMRAEKSDPKLIQGIFGQGVLRNMTEARFSGFLLYSILSVHPKEYNILHSRRWKYLGFVWILCSICVYLLLYLETIHLYNIYSNVKNMW